ncbi:hypothetical protein CDL12_17765 [Handroanthus impetiginosus]|uniref:Uncharacterized protein n=1 Tax=Handroanthus impetiginosus TaxID=429701 RepID=A0A2G9GWJ6_9LAMI|nr:hypothetical protein CDL12_17765 [Handroanthus impetiginosus]
MDQRMNPRGIRKNITGRIESSRPVSLSRAAKIMSRFAAAENHSTPTVSMYLHRTADALNKLVRVHEKISSKKKRNQEKMMSRNHQIDSENSVVNDNKTITVNGDGLADHGTDDHEAIKDSLEGLGMEKKNKMKKKMKKKMKITDDHDDEVDSKEEPLP